MMSSRISRTMEESGESARETRPTALVVVMEGVVRSALEQALLAWGFRVLAAEDFGLPSAADPRGVDLLITDLEVMGSELGDRLLGRAASVLFVSGTPRQRGWPLPQGRQVTCLRKPFNVRTLAAKILEARRFSAHHGELWAQPARIPA